jgi:hypothetical protein
MWHDLGHHQLMGFQVVAIVAVDQQLHAGIAVLADPIELETSLLRGRQADWGESKLCEDLLCFR